VTFLDDYLTYLDLATWLPEEFKIASGLMALSAITGRKIGVAYSTQIYYPNMYYMLVGPSNSGKGVAIEHTCQRIISYIAPEYILPERFTPEGLLKELSSRNEARGVILNDEMSDMLPAKKYMEGIADILTSLYNTTLDTKRMRYSEKTYTLHYPYFSLFTGIQPENVTEFISTRNITSGFIPRFLIFYSQGKKRERINTRKALPYWNSAVNKLETLHQVLVKIKGPCLIPIEDLVVDVIFEYTGQLVSKIYNEEDKICFRRLTDHLFKLSLLFYINNLTYLSKKAITTILRYYETNTAFSTSPSAGADRGTEDVPNVPNVPKIPKVPNVPILVPKNSERPALNVPNVSKISNKSNVPNVSNVSNVPRVNSKGVYTLRDTGTRGTLLAASSVKGSKKINRSVPADSVAETVPVKYGTNIVHHHIGFIGIEELALAIGLIETIKDGILETSALITDSIEAKELELCRRAVAKLIKREKFIVVKGKRYIVFRDLVKTLKRPVRRVMPYIETLQDEGLLGEIKYLKKENNRRIKIIEYLGDVGSPTDGVPWNVNMLARGE